MTVCNCFRTGSSAETWVNCCQRSSLTGKLALWSTSSSSRKNTGIDFRQIGTALSVRNQHLLSFQVSDIQTVLLQPKQHPLKTLGGCTKFFPENGLEGLVICLHSNTITAINVRIKLLMREGNHQQLLLYLGVIYFLVSQRAQHRLPTL